MKKLDIDKVYKDEEKSSLLRRTSKIKVKKEVSWRKLPNSNEPARGGNFILKELNSF